MPRRPEIGNIQLYPERPLRLSDKNGYVLKFYCPIQKKRIRKNCGTRLRREARKILRECRERLLNGNYIESNGAITESLELISASSKRVKLQTNKTSSLTWEECFEHYYQNRKKRVREKSLDDIASRLQIAQRILAGYAEDIVRAEIGSIAEYSTLEAIEYLQDRLLEGDECRYDTRSPTTVNTTMGAVMAFVRYCHRHGWIADIPPVAKLDVEHTMKGRPIKFEEFEQMLNSVPDVVGKRPADSWKYVLKILWETAFRIGDVMNFSWDDDRRIHPNWPGRGQHPTLIVPSSQKNKKTQEIPMLPGLQKLLEQTPKRNRHGWVVNPLPIDYEIRSQNAWFKPTSKDLKTLVKSYNNCAIAKACGVSETTVRNWLKKEAILRKTEFDRHHGDIENKIIQQIRNRSKQQAGHSATHRVKRLTKERVSRIISMVGKEAGIVVQQPDEETGRRLKYASAHDLRRGCAQRLINAGVSAETLKVLMRHKDFNTTERYYAGSREAQSAASEIHAKLDDGIGSSASLRNIEDSAQLSDDEVKKLKSLLNSL